MRRPKNMTKASVVFAMCASLMIAVPAFSAAGHAATQGTAKPAVHHKHKHHKHNTKASAAFVATTLTGTDIYLCASSGSVTMPDAVSVPIWGFSQDTTPGTPGGCAPASLPGPVIDVPAGSPVTVHLNNQLTDRAVSLLFDGQSLIPDRAGAPANGGTATYTFTPSAGTYLYQAGTDVTRQVPMGLYGALVVEPCATLPCSQAYANANTAYDASAVMVLSEIDPNMSGDPDAFNPLDYDPQYFLINGQAYPDVPAIDVGGTGGSAGRRLLVRYLNAGSEHHTMMLLGLRETFVAKDAFPTPYPYSLDSETIAAGSTADAIITIPAGTQAGAKFALFNRNLDLSNGLYGATNHTPGGMMTFIAVP